MSAPKINNSVSRIWTKAQLKVTLTQAKANGFIISKHFLFPNNTVVTNPANNEHVLSAAPGFNGMMIVRIDQSYFGK